MFQRFDDGGVRILQRRVLSDQNDIDLVKQAVVPAQKFVSILDTRRQAKRSSPNRQSLPHGHKLLTAKDPRLVRDYIGELQTRLKVLDEALRLEE